MVGDKLVLHYTQSEAVDHVGQLRHPLAREALRKHGIENNFEVSSMADLPAGTGLGSSSCYIVGLLNALHHDRRDYVSLQTLAEEACYIELEILKEGIGKQDQYMAAYGGLTVLEIEPGGAVKVRQLRPSSSDVADFVAHTHIYYTGAQRDAGEVLADAERRHAEQGERRPRARGGEPPPHQGASATASWRRSRAELRPRGAAADGTGRTRRSSPRRSRSARVDSDLRELRARFGVLGGKIIGAGGGGSPDALACAAASHDRARALHGSERACRRCTTPSTPEWDQGHHPDRAGVYWRAVTPS